MALSLGCGACSLFSSCCNCSGCSFDVVLDDDDDHDDDGDIFPWLVGLVVVALLDDDGDHQHHHHHHHHHNHHHNHHHWFSGCRFSPGCSWSHCSCGVLAGFDL